MENRRYGFLSHSQQSVAESIGSFDLAAVLRGLSEVFIFRFNLRRVLKSSYIEVFHCLARQTLKFMLMAVRGDSTAARGEALRECSQEMKKYYCSLVQSIAKEKLMSEVDILLILICLCSRRFFESLLGIPWGNYEEEFAKRETTIESYAYMILTHEITGDVVSRLAFDCLKKKYIRKVIFKSTHREEQELGMARSLKYIEKQLSKNAMVNSRNELDEETRGGRKKKFHQFLRSALRIDNPLEQKSNDLLVQDRVSSTFEDLLGRNQNSKEAAEGSARKSKPKKFNRVSEAMKWQHDSETKDTLPSELFIEKFKSRSLKNKKHPRHTLAGKPSMLLESKHPRKRLKKKVNDFNWKSWQSILKGLKEKKNGFSVEKFDSEIYHRRLDSRHLHESHAAEAKTVTANKPKEEDTKSRTVESVKSEIRNLEVKVAGMEPMGSMESRESRESREGKKRLPKIKNTLHFFKKKLKEFESQCLERERWLEGGLCPERRQCLERGQCLGRGQGLERGQVSLL